jgi:hypothetical protein
MILKWVWLCGDFVLQRERLCISTSARQNVRSTHVTNCCCCCCCCCSNCVLLFTNPAAPFIAATNLQLAT